MGQGCCIPIQPDVPIALENRKVNAGWSRMVQSVRDFEQLDNAINRWRAVDISYFQTVFSKKATTAVKPIKASPIASQYLLAESLSEIFLGLTCQKRDLVLFDFSVFTKPSTLKNHKNIYTLHSIVGVSTNSTSESPKSSTVTSTTIPLYFGAGELLRAMSLSGFLSGSLYLDNVDSCLIPVLREDTIDFRDFVHALAICALGTLKEMLIFLFLLFADQSITMDSSGALVSTSIQSKMNSRGGKSLSSGFFGASDGDSSRKSGRVAILSNGTASGDASDSRSVDTDATGSTTSTFGGHPVRGAKAKSKVPAAAKGSTLDVVPEKENEEEIGDGLSNTSSNMDSYQPALSKTAVERLLQFVAFWQLIWNDEVNEDDSASKSTRVMKLEWIVEKSQAVGSSYALLLESFVGPEHHPISTEGVAVERRPSAGASARSLVSASPQSSLDAQTTTGLYPLTLKAFINAAQAASQVIPPSAAAGIDVFGTSLLSADSLQRSLRIFTLNTPPSQERAAVSRSLSISAKTVPKQVYVINTRWWNDWCQYVNVSPRYSEKIPGLVEAIVPGSISTDFVKTSANGRRNSRSKSLLPQITAIKNISKPDLIDNSYVQDTSRPYLLTEKMIQPINDYILLAPQTWQVLAPNYAGSLTGSHEIGVHRPIVRYVSPSPNGGAPVVLLRPLMVYVHWCTAFGVCTESALDRLQCCNCGSASKKEDHTSRCVRALSGNPDDDKKINSTSPYVCCSANDILCRVLEDHCLKHANGSQSIDIRDVRIWIQKVQSDTAEGKRWDISRGIIPVLPYYQSRAYSVSPGRHWHLISDEERSLPLSSLVHSDRICSVMIESLNVHGNWPTMEIYSDPKPKWIKILDSTKKRKVGEVVIARARDGLWYQGVVQGLEAGSGIQEEKYRIQFEKPTCSSSSAFWEEKVALASVAPLPSITWPTALQVCGSLQTPVSPHASVSETLRAPSISSTKVDSEVEVLPAVEMGQRLAGRGTSGSRLGGTDSVGDLELFTRNTSTNSSIANKLMVSTGLGSSIVPQDGAINSLPLIRAMSLRHALNCIPFVDSFGLYESEISDLVKSLATVTAAASAKVSDNARPNRQQGKESCEDASSATPNSLPRQVSYLPSQRLPTGVCGLWNMGNTCYMSAALQCLVHTPFLFRYFLSGRYIRDLNRTNAFGTGGKLTDEFAALLLMLWVIANPSLAAGNTANATASPNATDSVGKVASTSASIKKPVSVSGVQVKSVEVQAAVTGQTSAKAPTFVTPKNFKRILDRTKSQFEGNHQQDSQEFLAALLDSLHEDLNKFDRKREESLRLQSGVEKSALKTPEKPSSASKKSPQTTPIDVSPAQSAAESNGQFVHFTPGSSTKKQLDLGNNFLSGSSSKQDAGGDAGIGSRNDSITKSAPKVDVNAKGQEAWASHISRNKSVVVDMFQGQQCTEVQCRTCSSSSYTFDPFMSISLPLPKQHEFTVVVYLLRKMPRVRALMEQIYSAQNSPQEIAQVFKQQAKNFLNIYRNNRHPIRLCVHTSRLAEVSELKSSICKAVDERNKRLESSKPFANRPLNSSNIMITDALQSTKDFLDLTRFLDDREPLVQLLDAHPGKDTTPSVIVFENCKDVPYILSIPGMFLQVRSRTKPPTVAKSNGGEERMSTTTDVSAPAVSAETNAEPSSPEKTVSTKPVACDSNTDEVEYTFPERSCEGDVITDINLGESADKSVPDCESKFPSSFSDFSLGLRVDAQDSRGNWFAASVLELWKVSSKELAIINQQIAESGQAPSVGSVPTDVGLHLRIHFDNFSAKWDEWMSETDFVNGRLAPIFSRSTRKVNFFEFIVYHRRGATLVGDESDAGVKSARSTRSIETESLPTHVELVGIPYVVQVEPFRSCEHLYRHIVEQSLRFANTEEVRSFLEATLQEYFQLYHEMQAVSNGSIHSSPQLPKIRWPYEALPFTVRLASVANVACPGVPTVLASRRLNTSTSQLSNPQSICTNWKFGREHINWEGSGFPSDRNRPVCNLFHTKLCVVVDWKPLVRTSSSNPTKAPSDSRFSSQEFDDDETFTTFSQSQLTLVKSTTNTAKAKDKGVTLQECLRVYAGHEDLDDNTWFCEKCKKLSKATVITSLQLIPDTLIIHIKRFNMTARFGEKIKTLVTFPLRGLNLYQFTTEYKLGKASSDESDVLQADVPQNYIYDLYGVTNHIGHMNGGHYTAFVNCHDYMEANVLGRNMTSTSAAVNAAGASSANRSKSSRGSGTARRSEAPEQYLDRLTHRLKLTPEDAAKLHAEGLYGACGDMSSIFSPSYSAGSEFGNQSNGQWFLFDDEVVEEVPPDNLTQCIVTDAAYLLFYRKRQFTPSTIVNLIS